MTNSQVKQAIDETIGSKSMLNEAFVEKVLMKKKPKKSLPFLQPVIVIILMLAIGAVLYVTPSKTEHSAVEIKEQYLNDVQTKLVEQYYSAILKKDKNALAEVATLSNDEVINRYKGFDLTKPLEVIKTIDKENELILFVKLQPAKDPSYSIYEKLLLNKANDKFVLSDAYEFKYYEQEIELPKKISLNYKTAPIAKRRETEIYYIENAEIQTLNGHTLYQLKTKQGTQRIFETVTGERFDLGVVSDGMTYYTVGDNNQFYLIDQITTMMTYIYRNEQGEYQIVTGELGERGITTYQTEVHEEPFIVTGGDQPKIITIQNGQLVYADFLEHAELENSIEFYSTESAGAMVLLKYTEDLKQISTYYELTSMNVYEDYRMRDVLIADPSHLQTMWLTNRYKGQLKVQFDNGTLYYRNNDRVDKEEPTFDHDPIWPETIEKTITNIKIETKDDQYFISGDNGFTWTLTRTAPRILKDEKGIEYTVPMDLDKLSESP